MKRVLLAGVVGAVVMFAWGFVSWVVLPWHNMTFHTFDDAEAVSRAVADNTPRAGAYLLPPMPHGIEGGPEAQKAAREVWTERHRAGPIAFMIIRPQGAEPGAPIIFARGLGIGFLASVLAAAILWLALPRTRGFSDRMAVVALIGPVVALDAHATFWNYFYGPADYSLVMIADTIIRWLLAGAAIAAIIRPSEPIGAPVPAGSPSEPLAAAAGAE
jgi:hypothetical protein